MYSSKIPLAINENDNTEIHGKTWWNATVDYCGVAESLMVKKQYMSVPVCCIRTSHVRTVHFSTRRTNIVRKYVLMYCFGYVKLISLTK